MRRLNSSVRVLRKPWARAALVVVLGGTTLFALAPRVNAMPLNMPMSMSMPQEGDPAAGEMVPHEPVEIQVSDGLHRVLTGLLCQCGCNLDAYVCQQTMTCDVSTAMWDQAAKLVDDQGVSPDRALVLFAEDYGERVLASPIKRGFNLMAWILPLASIVVGASILAFALRGWRGRRDTSVPISTPPVDPRYLDALERELAEEA